MASTLLRPTVMSLLEVATGSSDHALRVEQMEVHEGDRVEPGDELVALGRREQIEPLRDCMSG